MWIFQNKHYVVLVHFGIHVIVSLSSRAMQAILRIQMADPSISVSFGFPRFIESILVSWLELLPDRGVILTRGWAAVEEETGTE
jgi:hypothetical protein